MDTKTKIYYSVAGSLILLVVCAAFLKYFVFKDYIITMHVDCDPASEHCFVSVCDPSEDDTCSKDPSEQMSYYKVIQKKAGRMPNCDPNSNSCVINCSNDNDCKIILCSPDSQDFGDTCSDENNLDGNLDTNSNSSDI